MIPAPKFGNLSSSSSGLMGDTCTSGAMATAGHNSTGGMPIEIKRSTQTVSAIGGKTGRISALDFTKGALVLVMVLYHWLNYFIGSQGSVYRYLSFLPPSFICITGFLIAQVYLSKSRISDPRLPQRLIVRGLKLLMIFILLNVGASLLIPGVHHGGRVVDSFSASNLESVFVTGNMAGGRTVAFYVLVPISYLLLLSAFLLIAHRYYQHIFHAMTLMCLLAIYVMFLNGSKSGNLELVTIGLLGISIGHMPLDRINHVLRHPFAVVLAYLCYAAAITVWNVPYPLQVAGVLLTLSILYLVGTASGETGKIQQLLIMLGKYSLFGYIAQIAILQLLRRSLGTDQAAWVLGSSFIAAIALTLFAVKAVDRARSKSATVNRLYAAVFS